MINNLKALFGKKCSGIKINPPGLSPINIPEKHMKFCEAVDYSFKVPIQINNHNLDCPESRKFRGVDNEEIVVGVPYEMAFHIDMEKDTVHNNN